MKPKIIVFLADGMADEALEELGGKTPVEYANTPYMDIIAGKGISGTFLSLPEGFPTSSDVANMSVLGYSLEKYYPGRGPLEALSKGIKLQEDDIAWRCNLVTVKNGILEDYSAGHISDTTSREIIEDLNVSFGNEKVSFHPGVSYRNLLVLHGEEFSDKIKYHKPDSSQGEAIDRLQLEPEDDSKEAKYTVEFLKELINKTAPFLTMHPLNENKANPANYIWPWSPGKKPALPAFSDLYGLKGAVISAVDVIKGIAKAAEMTVIEVEGATGFIDTNYTGKAQAAIDAIKEFDFIYLHVEATDECSHMGDLKLKLQAIEDFDAKIVKPVLEALKNEDVRFALLPDHPVPIKLRRHTRTPVPVSICGPGIQPDEVDSYSETKATYGKLGALRKDEFLRFLIRT